MKVLGHIYVVLEAAGKRNSPLLVWGSILPEMSPYIRSCPFTWEQIHERGEDVVKFLQKNKPELVDLGMGLMAHSVRWGADKFDSFEEIEKLGYKRGVDAEFEKDVAESAGLTDLDVAQRRVHNLLDLSLEYYIFQHHDWVLEDLKKAFGEVAVPELAKPLAECFGKDPKVAEVAINDLKEVFVPEDLTTVPGLARTWLRYTSGLPDGLTDLGKTEQVIKRSCQIIAGKEEEFLHSAVEWTRENIKPYLDLQRR